MFKGQVGMLFQTVMEGSKQVRRALPNASSVGIETPECFHAEFNVYNSGQYGNQGVVTINCNVPVQLAPYASNLIGLVPRNARLGGRSWIEEPLDIEALRSDNARLRGIVRALCHAESKAKASRIAHHIMGTTLDVEGVYRGPR